MVALFIAGQAHAEGPKSVNELLQTRTALMGREQALMKARETTQQRVDRLKTALGSQEKRLDFIDGNLDAVRCEIVKTEQELKQIK